MESRIKIMVFEPGKKPHIEWLKNVTEAYKSVVEGNVRTQQLDSKSVLVSNADNTLPFLKPNRHFGGEIICGTFFIASAGENGHYGSIPMNVCGIITICTISRKPFRKKN